MVIKEVKNSSMRYAKGFCFSANYSVFTTGRTAFICDNKFNLLHKVENLSYVYSTYISPDENYLLLVSNDHMFYLVDLNDFSKKKYTIRDKYNDNLEGRGCWSFDSQSLYFNVCNPQTLNSALRRYDLYTDMSHEDMLIEKYWLFSLQPVKELNKYLLLGLDRKKREANRIDCYTMIWFDGVSFEEYPIRSVDVDEAMISSAEYEAETNTVILYGYSRTFRCDLKGKVMKKIAYYNVEKVTASFSDTFFNAGYTKDNFDMLRNLYAAAGLENMAMDDGINQICLSSDGKKYYIGSHLGFCIIDAETKKIQLKKNISYGVQKIQEISPNMIAISTWNGVKIYNVIE
jgi:hypothetical protein